MSWIYKYTSKILICLGGCVLLVVGTIAFAQGSTVATPDLFHDSDIINQIVAFLSWIWIVIAMGAGKLMTNTFVYGEFMNFDVYLRQMWNISKNFANIAIGFMFAMYVRKLVFQSDQSTGNEIGKKIGGFLLAGVLIQMSWFFMGALLDVEKITTSAMGALPGLVIQDNNIWGQHIVGAMSNSEIQGKVFTLEKDRNDPLATVTANYSSPASFAVQNNARSTLDSILPSYDSLAGPLYFIGFAMFKFHSYSTINVGSINNIKDVSWVLTGVGIKFLVLCAFVLMMTLLFFINIVRVAYLWMVIAFAPIIVLYLVLKHVMGMEMNIGSDDNGILSKINLPTILAYIFQPTIIVTFMGLMLIAVTALWAGMDTSTTPIVEYGLTISSGGVEHSTFHLETQGDLLSNVGNTGRGIFKDLLLLMLVFGLLMGLIVLSASSLKIQVIEKIAKNLWKTIASIPMIPIATTARAGNNILKDTVGVDLASPATRGKLDIKGDNALRELMGLPSNANTSKDDQFRRDLGLYTSNPTQFFGTIQAWMASRGAAGLTLGGSNPTLGFPGAIVNFLQANGNDENIMSRYGLSTVDKVASLKDKKLSELAIDDLETYLKYDKNTQKMYNALMGYNKNNTTPTITTRDLLEKPLTKQKPAPVS